MQATNLCEVNHHARIQTAAARHAGPQPYPGEEERDNDALRPNDPADRPDTDDDVEQAEQDLEHLHDKARPL